MSASCRLRQAWDWMNYDEIAIVSDALLDIIHSEDEHPILIDVGAHTGTSARPFLHAGWEVFAFEPDHTNRSKLQTIGSDRLHISPLAVSDKVSDGRSFFTSAVSTGISTLDSFHGSHERTQTVSTTTLEVFFAEAGISNIEVLKVDVEGHELAVLAGMDWSVGPQVVVCEFDETKATEHPSSASRVVEALEEVGLTVIVSEWEPVVEYGRHHKPRRIAAPDEQVTPDSWGNVVGFATPELRDRFAVAATRRIRRARALHPLLLAATGVRRRLASRRAYHTVP